MIARQVTQTGMVQFTMVDDDRVIVTASEYDGHSVSISMPADLFDAMVDQAVSYRLVDPLIPA